MLYQILLTSLYAACAVASPTLSKRAVTCVEVGSQATATWTNAAGQQCSFTGTVGSNFGPNPSGSGDYSCNGRCGAGCSGFAVGNVYTLDCYSHDICSYFESASGGSRYGFRCSTNQGKAKFANWFSSDPNCGGAYDAAVDDTLTGAANGCGRDNPSNAVAQPSTQPVCV